MKHLRPGEYGFLLLTSNLGDPGRKPLTVAQMRELFHRSEQMKKSDISRDVDVYDFVSIGYSPKAAQRIINLLQDEVLLQYYLIRARKADCQPVTRATESYPPLLRRRLGLDSPGTLWAKGDLSILNTPMIALVGSRDVHPENKAFAVEVGRQAALQGFTLVSGNARGSDKLAQNACLEAGGRVISVVADSLASRKSKDRVLYLSEYGFDEEFSAQRALSRNRIIHALADKTFVAQVYAGYGGTWDGTVKNLRNAWSPVLCYADGSAGALQLSQMGAVLIGMEDLGDIGALTSGQKSFFTE